MATGFMAGAVVGKLILDKTQWSKSAKTVKDDEKKFTGMSTRMTAGFRKTGAAMTVAGAAIVAGLGSMIKKYVEAGDQIDKMSRRTGIAATTLSELKYAADITGASFTDVEKGVKRMAKTIADAGDGMATYIRSFDRLGISVEEIKKLNPEEQFFAIGDAIASIEDPSLRAATAQDIFGRAGTQLLPLFAEGEEGLQKLREEAHKLGIVFDQEAALKAAVLKDAQTALGESMKGLSFTLAENLVPALTNIVGKITEVVTNVTAWAKAHPGLFKTIVKVVAGLGGFLTVLGPMVIMIPKFVVGIKTIGVAMKAAMGPIGIVTGLLLAAGAAMNAWINARKKALDAEMDAMIADKTLGNTLELRRKLIEDNIITQEEWTALVNEHGRDYKAVMNAIATDPSLGHMKDALDGIIETTEDTGDANEDLGTDYEDLMGQIGGTNEVMKTWVDYLKDNAILTLEAKGEKVEELEGYLGDLDTAYKDGKISLEDYNTAQELAHDELVELGAASKTYYDHLKELGIPTIEEQKEQIGDVTEQLDSLNTAYEEGEISQDNYEKGVKILESALEDINTDFILVDGMVQQLGVHFDAFVPKARAFGGALADMYSPIIQKTEDFEVQTFETVENVSTAWSDMADGLKTKWSETLGDFVASGDIFKGDFKGLVDAMKTQFFDMVGQMAAKIVTGLFDVIIDGAANAAQSLLGSLGSALGGDGKDLAGGISSVTGAVSSLANPVNMISGAVTAIASVITALQGPGGPSTTDSWNFEHTQINTKELRDYVFINIGSASGWLAKTYDRNTDTFVTLQTIRKLTREKVAGPLKGIEKNTGDTVSALKNLPGAQHGYKSTRNELVELHGTPQDPEHVIRDSDFSRLMNTAPAASSATYNVNVANTVTIPGLMVTDREYTRDRVIPEFLAALRAHLGKTELKEILGLT
jgi:hypothetical protein